MDKSRAVRAYHQNNVDRLTNDELVAEKKQMRINRNKLKEKLLHLRRSGAAIKVVE